MDDGIQAKQELMAEASAFELCQTAPRPVLLEVNFLEGALAERARPLVTATLARFGDRVQLCKVDANESADLCERFSVESVPTLLVFCHGHHIGSFSHQASPSDLIQAIEGALIPLVFQLDCGPGLSPGGAYRIPLRLENKGEQVLRDLEVSMTSALFAETTCRVRVLRPQESKVVRDLSIQLDRHGRDPYCAIKLRGTGVCPPLSAVVGYFELEVLPVSSQTGHQHASVQINVRNLLGDVSVDQSSRGLSGQQSPLDMLAGSLLGNVHLGQPADGGGAGTPTRLGPSWQRLPLEVEEIPFPSSLADGWEEFVAKYEGGAVFEGCRPGSVSGGRPRDVWHSSSFRKAAEKQLCPFGEAPDGVYRMELFEREGGRFLAIAYEKQGPRFVSHWRTNDREYAQRYQDVFGDV